MVLSSTDVVATAGAAVSGLFMNGFLLERSVAGVTNKVSLMIQKPAFRGTTIKHLK